MQVDIQTAVKFANKTIMQQVKKKVYNPLNKVGFEMRKYAQDLVNRKYNGKPSQPGEPPKLRTGKLRKAILYRVQEWDLWVGIIKKSREFYAHLLEFGGTFTVKRKGKSKGKRIGQTRTIAPRPFMVPTLEKNKSKIPSKFNSFLIK